MQQKTRKITEKFAPILLLHNNSSHASPFWETQPLIKGGSSESLIAHFWRSQNFSPQVVTDRSQLFTEGFILNILKLHPPRLISHTVFLKVINEKNASLKKANFVSSLMIRAADRHTSRNLSLRIFPQSYVKVNNGMQ